MHTPMSRDWKDKTSQGRVDDSEERKKELAQIYLRACHKNNLEVIGITDHNFAPSEDQSFIRWLREENASIAIEFGRDPLIIFPGFEVEANVGKGCHVICLFPPETPLNIVESRLTALDLPPDNRFEGEQPKHSKKNLQDLLNAIQRDPNVRGIVICAHSTEQHGIFDDEKIAEWLQKDEYINHDLLCVEIPKSIDAMSEGWRHLLRCDDKCQPEWRRDHPIACIMSSDSYGLEKSDILNSNYIGYRHTWIKMSDPSIESLRQAFLDHESRVRFGVTSPETRYSYPKIRSVKVNGASFLRRTETLNFSPNLNCLIGSRGTGKSTIVDYVRLVLDHMRAEDIPSTLADEIKGRVTGTLLTTSTIELELETVGGVYNVLYQNDANPKRQITPPNSDKPDLTLDIRTLFPCRMLSQREIDHSVGKRDQMALLKFLDDFIVAELTELSRQESQIRGKISQTEATLLPKLENQGRRSGLETAKRDLQLQLENQKKLSALLPRWQELVRERDFFQRLFTECENIATRLDEQIGNIQLENAKVPELLTNCSEVAIIKEAAALAEKSVTQLKKSLTTSVDTFKVVVQRENSVISRIHNEQWKPVFTQVEKEFQEAQKEAQENGTAVDDIANIPQRLIELEAEITKLDTELIEIQQLETLRKALVIELQGIWLKQTDTRVQKATELMSRLRPYPDGKPSVEIEVHHQGQFEELVRELEGKIRDRRSLNEEDVRSVLYYIIEHSAEKTRPTLQVFIDEVRKGDASHLIKNGLDNKDRKKEALDKAFLEPVLRQLEVKRISDSVTYKVYRLDGTLAGPIEKVSAGQQGTAILNLLLASGNEPLIIDTPEEGLDNEGVYAELVPLFRREKESRQIIVVTHNANIPVNADAEGIIALEAGGYLNETELTAIVKDAGQEMNTSELNNLSDLIRWSDWEKRVRAYLNGNKHWSPDNITTVISRIGRTRSAEGRIKRVSTSSTEARLAVGALDAGAVKRAVQDIMEGSAIAFRKRREKYGF